MSVVEFEVLEGIAPFLERELATLAGRGSRVLGSTATSVTIDWAGPLERVNASRFAVAPWLVRHFDVPRPKALLGHQHLNELLRDMARAFALWPEGEITSFRFSAAGKTSPVFTRLAQMISDATDLAHDAERGGVVIRVRPRPEGDGWETLVRLTPRPLSARPWRVHDLPGALNATIAAALVDLTAPVRRDRVLNLMCGSGTLLIERAAVGPMRSLIGIDVEPVAAQNLAAARVHASIATADARQLPFRNASFDVVLMDPPYGHRMGSHDSNDALYRDTLREAARVVARNGRAAIITHELRRFEAALRHAEEWVETSTTRVFQKGHRPGLWLLTRRS